MSQSDTGNRDFDRIERKKEENQPVEEAGGGVAEGFEQSEQELIEKAEGEAGSGHPLGDRFPPEAEDPNQLPPHGEANHEDSSAATGKD